MYIGVTCISEEDKELYIHKTKSIRMMTRISWCLLLTETNGFPVRIVSESIKITKRRSTYSTARVNLFSSVA